MARYIDADALCRLIDSYLSIPRLNNDFIAGVQKAKKMIEAMPTAEMQKVEELPRFPLKGSKSLEIRKILQDDEKVMVLDKPIILEPRKEKENAKSFL